MMLNVVYGKSATTAKLELKRGVVRRQSGNFHLSYRLEQGESASVPCTSVSLAEGEPLWSGSRFQKLAGSRFPVELNCYAPNEVVVGAVGGGGGLQLLTGNGGAFHPADARWKRLRARPGRHDSLLHATSIARLALRSQTSPRKEQITTPITLKHHSQHVSSAVLFHSCAFQFSSLLHGAGYTCNGEVANSAP